jgi:hypothetical protein
VCGQALAEGPGPGQQGVDAPVRRAVLVLVAEARRGVVAGAQFVEDRDALPGQPPGAALRGAQLAGERLRAERVEGGIGQQQRQPLGLAHELRGRRERLVRDRAAQHGIPVVRLDGPRLEPVQAQREGGVAPHHRLRGVHRGEPTGRRRVTAAIGRERPSGGCACVRVMPGDPPCGYATGPG